MRLLLEWDEKKCARNEAERGIPFSDADRFDWASAYTFVDDRIDYGEERQRTLGLIDGAVHVLVTTLRGERLRVISLRRANARKRRRYAKERGQSG